MPPSVIHVGMKKNNGEQREKETQQKNKIRPVIQVQKQAGANGYTYNKKQSRDKQ